MYYTISGAWNRTNLTKLMNDLDSWKVSMLWIFAYTMKWIFYSHLLDQVAAKRSNQVHPIQSYTILTHCCRSVQVWIIHIFFRRVNGQYLFQSITNSHSICQVSTTDFSGADRLKEAVKRQHIMPSWIPKVLWSFFLKNYPKLPFLLRRAKNFLQWLFCISTRRILH